MNLQITKTVQLFDTDIIEKYKDKTGWFDVERPMSRASMYDTFITLGFTREQTLVLLASLGLVGVAFTDDTIMLND